MTWNDTGVSLLGAPGADGKTVLSGTTTPGGGLGSNGDFYIRTTTSDIYGPKAGGSWGSPTSLIGATGSTGGAGSAGADGKTVRNGAGAPSGGLGADGDFYVNTTATTIYGPKTSGAWGSATALIGATGSPGADGADGNGLVWSDRVETLADGSSVSPNALNGLIQVGVWTCATATPTLNAPSNGATGQPYRVQILASGANRVISLSGIAASTDDLVTAITVVQNKWTSLFLEYFDTAGWVYMGKKAQQ
jgi:hypothetical protein